MPQKCLEDEIRLQSGVKGKSSYYLRKEYWEEIKDKLWGTRFWSPSYCVVSCGGAPLDVVKQYISDQKRPPERKNIEKSKRYLGRKRDNDRNWLA